MGFGRAAHTRETSFDREVKLRVRAIGLVRDFVGDGDWEKKFPAQLNGPKSFSFFSKE